MTDAVEPIEVPSTEDVSGEPAADGPPAADGAAAVETGGGAPMVDGAPAPIDGTPAPIELTETALEALLFVAEKPLSRREIAALAGTDRATVDARLGDLEVSLRDRGIRLLIDGDRVELATASDGGALVARYIGADVVRLSPASLETLAIVAYRQPVTKAAIERIRGVDSDYTDPDAAPSPVRGGARPAPPLPAGRSCTAPASSSSNGSR